MEVPLPQSSPCGLCSPLCLCSQGGRLWQRPGQGCSPREPHLKEAQILGPLRGLGAGLSVVLPLATT